MPRALTKVQRALLTRAIRDEGLVILPTTLQGAAAAKLVRPLLARGLLREVPSGSGPEAWRPGWALVVTRAGREAVERGRRSRQEMLD
jgi:hypothetical protein